MVVLEDRQQALAELSRIASETSRSGWDGYGAAAVASEVLARSKKFIEELPDDIPLPDLSAEPDGEIGMEWFVDERHRFSVSVGSRSKVAFAGISGSAEWYGAEEFTGPIPHTLIYQIRGVLQP